MWFDQLEGASVFSRIDFGTGYYQLRFDESDVAMWLSDLGASIRSSWSRYLVDQCSVDRVNLMDQVFRRFLDELRSCSLATS